MSLETCPLVRGKREKEHPPKHERKFSHIGIFETIPRISCPVRIWRKFSKASMPGTKFVNFREKVNESLVSLK